MFLIKSIHQVNYKKKKEHANSALGRKWGREAKHTSLGGGQAGMVGGLGGCSLITLSSTGVVWAFSCVAGRSCMPCPCGAHPHRGGGKVMY